MNKVKDIREKVAQNCADYAMGLFAMDFSQDVSGLESLLIDDLKLKKIKK